MLAADGGDIELIDIKEGKVQIRLLGACRGCPLSQITLRSGVERALRAAIPEILEVVAVSNNVLGY
jgi:Fe-S cluster biogenesis protein NfuA